MIAVELKNLNLKYTNEMVMHSSTSNGMHKFIGKGYLDNK